MTSILQCVDCGRQYPLNQVVFTCETCGGLLDVIHDMDTLKKTITRETFDWTPGGTRAAYNSGVWRYKELVFPGAALDQIITRGEGNTNLYACRPELAAGSAWQTLMLKHEGENPTGSFKDRGMTGGVTHAACSSAQPSRVRLDRQHLRLDGLLRSAGRDRRRWCSSRTATVAMGKLAQSVAYGADACRSRAILTPAWLVREVDGRLGIYLLNSVNPFRLEGQKTIVLEIASAAPLEGAGLDRAVRAATWATPPPSGRPCGSCTPWA